jgi:IS5 family transposase
MRFKKVAVDTPTAKADDLFRSRLDGQIDLKHPLFKLGERMDWAALDDVLAPTLPQAGSGRPALPVRLMAGLIYLKHANNLSDEDT